jgi:hypothetical protein
MCHPFLPFMKEKGRKTRTVGESETSSDVARGGVVAK